MKISDEVMVHGFIDEIRNDVIIIRNDGGFFGTTKDEVSTAQPKRGEWMRLYDNIWICNNCEKTEQFGENIESTSSFCPNCGARMTDLEKPNNCERKE